MNEHTRTAGENDVLLHAFGQPFSNKPLPTCGTCGDVIPERNCLYNVRVCRCTPMRTPSIATQLSKMDQAGEVAGTRDALHTGYVLPNRAAPAAPVEHSSVLVTALQRIARWHGEFPSAKLATGEACSYGLAYGSNGERDYMRQVALDALAAAPAAPFAGSIGNDRKFCRLARAWDEAEYRTEAAIAAWDALIAYIDSRASAPAKVEWISVEARLPEAEISVLVMAPEWERSCIAAHFPGDEMNRAEWQDDSGEEVEPPPTAWMPLPDALATQQKGE